MPGKNPRSLLPPSPLTDEEIAEALHAHHGLVSHAAESLGYTFRAILGRIAKSPYLQRERDAARSARAHRAEVALSQLVDNPEHSDHFKAVKYTLDNLGRQDGWGRIDHRVTLAVDPLQEARSLLGLTAALPAPALPEGEEEAE